MKAFNRCVTKLPQFDTEKQLQKCAGKFLGRWLFALHRMPLTTTVKYCFAKYHEMRRLLVHSSFFYSRDSHLGMCNSTSLMVLSSNGAALLVFILLVPFWRIVLLVRWWLRFAFAINMFRFNSTAWITRAVL